MAENIVKLIGLLHFKDIIMTISRATDHTIFDFEYLFSSFLA